MCNSINGNTVKRCKGCEYLQELVLTSNPPQYETVCMRTLMRKSENDICDVYDEVIKIQSLNDLAVPNKEKSTALDEVIDSSCIFEGILATPEKYDIGVLNIDNIDSLINIIRELIINKYDISVKTIPINKGMCVVKYELTYSNKRK